MGTISVEAFVDSDEGLCGAILREERDGLLRTRTALRMGADAPVYQVDDEIRFDGDVRNWQSFTYTTQPSGLTRQGKRPDTGEVHIDGVEQVALQQGIPSYADCLLVPAAVGSAHGVLEYERFDEASLACAHAALRLDGDEEIALFDGSQVVAQKVQLVVGGKPGNTFWVVGEQVVKSDWCGAQSFLLECPEGVFDDLDEEVQALISSFGS